MIEPKTFYRELDSILSNIGGKKSDKNFFRSILMEVEQKFGQKLNIANGHVYERRGDDYILIISCHDNNEKLIQTKIPFKTETVTQLQKNGIMIFDRLYFMKDFNFGINYEKITPAAISVHNPVRKWLLVFELTEGWISEEIMLFLNAMRTAINYRLFSEMMQNDLKRAEQIQSSLLPKVSPKFKGFEVYGHSQPAEVVGGDFYEYFRFDDEDFGASIGDASGHGIPAALLVRDVVIGLRMGLAKEMRLVHTIKKLNQVIQKSTYSTNFVSLFIGEIENNDHLFYVNAGHPPPFLVSGDQITDLEATGITLGFLPDIDLTRGYIHLQSDSILVLYSDGIVEREKNEDEQFDIQRLKDLVVANRKKSAEDIVKLIYRTVYDFGNRKTWEDDATVVVIKKTDQTS